MTESNKFKQTEDLNQRIDDIEEKQIRILDQLIDDRREVLLEQIGKIEFFNEYYEKGLRDKLLVTYDDNAGAIYYDIRQNMFINEESTLKYLSDGIVGIGYFREAYKAIDDSKRYVKRYNEYLTGIYKKRIEDMEELNLNY